MEPIFVKTETPKPQWGDETEPTAVSKLPTYKVEKKPVQRRTAREEFGTLSSILNDVRRLRFKKTQRQKILKLYFVPEAEKEIKEIDEQIELLLKVHEQMRALLGRLDAGRPTGSEEPEELEESDVTSEVSNDA